jgi:aldose 1-epimerase
MKTFTIENNDLKITLLDVGATLYSFVIKNKNNRNIVLSTKNLSRYKNDKNGYFGATVGQVAGRIPHGHFKIDDVDYYLTPNEKVTNVLHGGNGSFAFKTFDVLRKSDTKIVFKLNVDEEQNEFPGALTLLVMYEVVGNELRLTYEATSTKKTIINITNHSYFNLNGLGNILDHNLQMNVVSYYKLNNLQINLFEVPIEDNSLFDFRRGKILKEVVKDKSIYHAPTMGIDHLFVVNDGTLNLSTNDLLLTITSDAPAFQIYSTNYPSHFKLLNGERVKMFQGLAIEPVEIVSSTNIHYPNLELLSNEKYTRVISYKVEEI